MIGKFYAIFKDNIFGFKKSFFSYIVKFSSVTQLYLTLCNPIDCSTTGLLVHHQLPEFTQTHVHWVMLPSNDLIFCHPLLLLSSIFPSIRIFSNESVLHITWPKYWNFSFSISPSNEYSGFISFKWNVWISLQSKGLSRVFFQHHSSKI